MDNPIDITRVDFTDIDDVIGFGSLLTSCAARCGIASGSTRQSGDAVRLTATARRWVNVVKPMLPEMPVADSFRLADTLDLVHRVAYRAPIDPRLSDKLLLDAFDAHIRGDRAIDEYLLYQAVDTQLRLMNRAFLNRPLQWLSTTLDRWRRDFMTRPAAPLGDYATIRRAAALIGADLFAWEGGSDEFQRQLFATHSHYLDETGHMTPAELEASSRFLTSSIRYLTTADYHRHDIAITNAIIAHPATNRFARQSLLLHLA